MKPSDRINGLTLEYFEREDKARAANRDWYYAEQRRSMVDHVQTWLDNLGPEDGYEWLTHYTADELADYFDVDDVPDINGEGSTSVSLDMSKWKAACGWVVEDLHGTQYTWHLTEERAMQEQQRWLDVWDEKTVVVPTKFFPRSR